MKAFIQFKYKIQENKELKEELEVLREQMRALLLTQGQG